MAITKNSQIDLNGNEMILDADGDTTITADTDDQIDIKVGGSDKVTINSAGDIGIGITPESHYSDYTNLDFGKTGLLLSASSGTNITSLLNNAYLNSSIAWKYKEADEASKYDQTGGTHLWFTAPTGGSADADLTWTQRLRLDSDGLKFGSDTSASNALDDYEEGTWTPTDASGASLSFSTIDKNRYTKIGRFVMAHARIDYPSTSNTSTATVSLPVTPSTDCIASVTGGVVVEQNYDANVTLTAAVDGTNGARFRINGVGALQNQNLSGKSVRFTVIYISA
jgi:hypothetical protein